MGTGSCCPNTTQGVCEVKGESYEKELIWLGFLPSPTEILGKIAHLSAACQGKAELYHGVHSVFDPAFLLLQGFLGLIRFDHKIIHNKKLNAFGVSIDLH